MQCADLVGFAASCVPSREAQGAHDLHLLGVIPKEGVLRVIAALEQSQSSQAAALKQRGSRFAPADRSDSST
jgi:hypothetical protein